MNSKTQSASLPEELHTAARKKFLELSLESTRKSYYPQLKKQLEKAKGDQKRLQLLIDTLPAQISYINHQEKYVLVNREFEKIFGKKQEQIIGRSTKKILGRKLYEDVKIHIDRALSGESGKFEFSFTTRENITKWLETNYVAETDKHGKTSGFYVLTIDLTDQKQAEEEKLKLKDRLRQSQKMEAIGTLSGGIAHDFNNILSGIFGYSELIDCHSSDARMVEGYNKKIFQAAKRASELIQQILSFSRQTQYAKHRITLRSIVKETVHLLRSTIPSNIEIKANLNSRATILAEPTQMHQVIMNLCTNAYHAMGDQNGTLTISLEEKKLPPDLLAAFTDAADELYLRLSVSDTGPGIPKEIREKIFDPYFTTKEMDRGTGLGLAVVDGIIKKHHGFIHLETQLGAGSSFHVYFPIIRHQVRKENEPGEKKNNSTPGKEKIMLVDDEQAILDTLKAILSRRGYQVSVFTNGQSALEAFSETPDAFDLMITDMTMPKMTGDKLAAEVLKIKKNLPIIICTGYNENFLEKDALAAGIKRYLSKPVFSTVLTGAIRELLDNPDD